MEINEYKCPNCSGAVKFDTSVQKLKCPYCDTEFEVDAFIEYQKSLDTQEKDEFDFDSKSVSEWNESEIGDLSTGCCPSCGAEVVGDSNTIATVCPCCGNTQIVKQRISGLLKPDYVIPFQLDKNAAIEALKRFYKHKRLLPDLFTQENRINSVQALYVPFWLFDAKARGHVVFKAVKTSSWADSVYSYTKTDYYSITRDGNLDFEKIPVDGSEKMNDDYMDAIEPFDYKLMKEFISSYLSGYLAEKYDVDVETSKERAIVKIKKSFEEQCAKSIQGYSSVTKESSHINVDNGKVSYALFPVWILNTKYKDENYQFIINGQSGKLIGKLPVDKNKVIKYLLMITGGIGLAGTIIIQIIRIFYPQLSKIGNFFLDILQVFQ